MCFLFPSACAVFNLYPRCIVCVIALLFRSSNPSRQMKQRQRKHDHAQGMGAWPRLPLQMEVPVSYGMSSGLEEFQGLLFLNFSLLLRSPVRLSRRLEIKQMWVASLISLCQCLSGSPWSMVVIGLCYSEPTLDRWEGCLDIHLEQHLLFFKGLQTLDATKLGSSSLQMVVDIILPT